MKKEKKINSRSWQLIIPLDFPFKDIADKIRLISKNYYFIKHDKDLDDFGQPKKEHFHFLFTFSNSRDLNTVKNYFSEFTKEDGEPYLLENSFEKISSAIGAKRYLCHFDHPNKAQYDYNEVETNDLLFKDLFLPQMAKEDEFDYYVESLLNTKNSCSIQDFIHKFKTRFTSMNSNQIFNNILRLVEYYKNHKESFPKDDGYDSTDYYPYRNEEREKDKQKENGEDLPF